MPLERLSREEALETIFNMLICLWNKNNRQTQRQEVSEQDWLRGNNRPWRRSFPRTDNFAKQNE